MKIKSNNRPDLPKVKFLCDFPIHEKLNKFELTKDFLNTPNTSIFLGRPGSGKTSLAVNLIRKVYKKCFHSVYVFMRETSRNSLENNIFDKYLDPSQIYEDLNYDGIEEVYDKLKENSKEGYYSLIIMDDVQDALKDINVLRSLRKIVANRRHLKVVTFILLQNWFSLDASLRRISNNLIMFKMDKKQQEQIFDNVIEQKREKFDEINRLVFDKPYTWLFVNIPTQRLFKEFDEIILEDDDDE